MLLVTQGIEFQYVEKFLNSVYLDITTYIIIAQDEMEVQFYSRSGNKWMVEIFDLPSDIVELPLFDMAFSLADIYDTVKI